MVTIFILETLHVYCMYYQCFVKPVRILLNCESVKLGGYLFAVLHPNDAINCIHIVLYYSKMVQMYSFHALF